MTNEELIKRLRDACLGGKTCKCSFNEAADRIEALARERDEARDAAVVWQEEFVEMNERWANTEIRLTKAVEALRAVLGACDQGRMIPRPGSGAGPMTIEANIRGCIYTGVPAWPIEEARAVLAEIGGEA